MSNDTLPGLIICRRLFNWRSVITLRTLDRCIPHDFYILNHSAVKVYHVLLTSALDGLR
jgi:hypothetical protein